MQSLTTFLSAIFGDAFAACGYDRSYGDVVLSNRPDLGDFQCNGALPAAREYKQNPRQIAQQVVDALSSREPFAAVGLAGPGFINIRLSDPFLAQHTGRMAADARRGVPAVAESQTIILDYGGPNAAKYMHVGHLRSSIIGDSIRRIFRFAGDEVIGDIHMGDWGLQMGMLITEIERHDPTLPYFDPDFEGPYPAESPVTMDDLQVMYPAVTARCREEPIAKEAARQATMELQSGRPGYFALWQHIHDISVNAIHEDVDQLGVSFNLWLGESDVRDRIEPLVNNLLADGIALESRGATIVDVSRPDDSQEYPPLILLKADGAALYGTTDLATIQQRMAEYRPDIIAYVVDVRQSLHFEQVFRAARMAGIVPPETGLEHLPFGTMNGPDGKPFKTRDGEVLLLRNFFATVKERARSRLEEMEVAADYPEAEREHIAQLVAVATLKFADLLNHRSKDYVFDLERFSAFEGRTGPYLLYTAVRIKSIMRKAQEAGLEPGEILPPAGPEERELQLKFTELPDVFQHSYETRSPNHLADYAYNLATLFNRFYREYHILSETDPGRQASWLAVSQYTLAQLELVLDLLGITVPERM
jgi:arginyl-tRNA synthetase